MLAHPLQLVLLFAAAFAAGAINSVAGGGTLLTFPALLAAGVPSVIANATNTVALVPGSVSGYWGFRGAEGGDARGRRAEMLALALPSLAGGAVGAVLAFHAGNALFSRLVPWLILGATGLFLVQDPVRRRLDGRDAGGSAPPRSRTPGGIVFQFFVAVYGGFFGAGIGILMLAALGLLGQTNLYRMNALKNFLAVCINGVASLTFILLRQVDWHLAPLMALGAVAGGWGGAGLARRVGQANVRRAVVAIGLSCGVYTLIRQI